MTLKPKTSIERDPARLHEALPWYVNGTLSDADRAWVEQRLAEEKRSVADARGQMDFDRYLCRALEHKLAQVPADIGWAALLQRVRMNAAAQHEGKSVQAHEAPASRHTAQGSVGTSWLQRLARMIARPMSPRVGMAMAVLVAAQTLAIGVLVSERRGGGTDTVEYRGSGDARPVAAIRALLDEAITEKAMREWLMAHGASIVDGPNQLGEYWILTGSRDPEAVAASLRRAGVIASYVIDYRPMGR